MAGKGVLKVFKGAIERTHLSSNSPVAVAVSGGCDSMALLWMAKQAFTNVVGLTVDHRLREGSAEEAIIAGELARGLGVQHQILRVEWEVSTPTPRKLQLEARMKRYTALLEYCTSSGVSTLMTAHHLDDQIETLVHRMSKGSGIDGLAGMHEISHRVAYPGIQLVRPLLSCHKQHLVATCKEAGLEWVEDPSNRHSYCSRNYIRQLLNSDPALCQGLYHMHTTLTLTMEPLRRGVDRIIRSLPVIDFEYGFVVLRKASLLQLSPPLLRRVLSALIRYVSADMRPVSYKSLAKLIAALPDVKTTTIHKCYVFAVDEDRIGICAAPDVTRVPIKVGEELNWIGKWELKLSSVVPPGEQYYIRPFRDDDHMILRARQRQLKLPPVRTRYALPVLTDSRGTVIAIPHFNYTNKKYRVILSVRYKPLIAMDYVLKSLA